MTGTDLDLARKFLEAGKLVAIPTETVYGLAANALDEQAVLRIFQAKNRPHFDPLIVHVSHKQLRDFNFEIPAEARELAAHHWPGPLTLLIKKPEFIPDIVCSGLGMVGLRMPDHPLTLALLEQLSFPLAAPSANPFKYVSPTTAKHVEDQLGGKVDYILDGGPSSVGLESTIISFEQPDRPTVLRLGGLPVDAIREHTKNLELDIQSGSNPSAPGQLEQHYATRTPLVFTDDIESALDEYADKRIAVIGFQELENYPATLNMDLSPKGDLREAAQNLFRMLRDADRPDIDLIVAVRVPNQGLGMAINDRLSRAKSRN